MNDAPRRRPRIKAIAAMTVVAIVAFATGLFLFNDVVMPRLVHRASEQRVPDLTNLTFPQAQRLLAARGLTLTRDGERFDPTVPNGFIVSQDPPPETPFRGHKKIGVIVSLGEEYSSVPELFGESMRTAAYLLTRAGLRLGGITHAPS